MDNNLIKNNISLYEIFISFLYSGLILLGGGYIILPILQNELVKKRKWLSDEDLIDYYAVSQSLPGLIAINISILTGYKLRGVKGAISAVCGITFFAFWAIVILSSVIAKFTSNNFVQSAFWGIGIAVIVLIISAIKEMWDKAITDLNTFIIFLIALLSMLVLKISPALIIIISIVGGILYKIAEKKGVVK